MVRPPGPPPPPPPPWEPEPPADNTGFEMTTISEGAGMNHGVIWTIVGVLAVIALLIFIIPRLT